MSLASDRADSEISLGSADGFEMPASTLGSEGAVAQRRLAGLRGNHLKCLQALKKSVPMVSEESRAEELAAKGKLQGRESTLEVIVKELQEEGAKDFQYLCGAMQKQVVGLESLRQQDSQYYNEELGKCIQAQVQEDELLCLQNLHSGISVLKENIEACDKIGAQRLQETHISLDRLRDSMKVQARCIAGMKAQDITQDAVSLHDALQRQSIFQELPALVKEAHSGMTSARQLLEKQAGDLAAFTAERLEQHQDHVDEVKQLHAGMLMQARCSVVKSEIEVLRRKEVAHEASAKVWQQEQLRLEGEVARLRRYEEMAANEAAARPPSRMTSCSQEAEGTNAAGMKRKCSYSSARSAGRAPAWVVPEAGALVAAAALGALFPLGVRVLLRLVWSATAAAALMPAGGAGLQALPPKPPTPLLLLPRVRRAGLTMQQERPASLWDAVGDVALAERRRRKRA